MRLASLGREKLDVSRYCGMTLSNLACHRQNRVPIVHAGGLKPLCDMAFDGERLEMQRAAGLALYNLSCAAANQASFRATAWARVNDRLVRRATHHSSSLFVHTTTSAKEHHVR